MKMNQLTIFRNEKFGEIRIFMNGDEPYFCLLDVCKALDLGNQNQVKTRLRANGVILNDTLTSRGKQKLNFINESNLYRVIFQSRKEEALKFQDWVCEIVIPQIRRSGFYYLMPKTYSEAMRSLRIETLQKEIFEKERDEAIATKAWISGRKTAQAMNTASQLSKKVKKLENQLQSILYYIPLI